MSLVAIKYAAAAPPWYRRIMQSLLYGRETDRARKTQARLGLAMMGFGFVVARFGLFLREMAAIRDVSPMHRTGFSLLVGTTLVLLGVAVNLAAAVKHWHTVRRLERGQPLNFSPWSLGMIVAGLLAVLGLLTVVYLLVGLDH